ncbi:MAG: alpha/beta hydrolase [Dehalococcoidia bacterium]|nr:alpha/beta hydrolase [Dehalococcoidia bacterium]
MKLVFVHGSGGTGIVWKHQTEFFRDADAVNLPGHLAPGEACSSVEDYARWLHEYVLAKGYERPVLAGHSLGGAIVLQYALDYPDGVGGLVLVGTGAKLWVAPHVLEAIEKGISSPKSWLSEFVEAQLTAVADVAFNAAAREAGMDKSLREQIAAQMAQVGARVQLNDFACCDRFNVMARLSEIKAPTLVLAGSLDVMTPPKYGEYLVEHIAGAKMVVIEGGTHHFFAEKPEQTNRAISHFLKSL